MFDKFTHRARKVMSLARQEAERSGKEYIGTEHILLGLVCEVTGIGARVLRNLCVDLRRVRSEVEKLIPNKSPTARSVQLPFTPRAKTVLELAQLEALTLGHDYIGTEHILLGLFRESDGVAAQVLLNLGLRPDQVRQEVLDVLVTEKAAIPARRIEDSSAFVALVKLAAGLPTPTWSEVMDFIAFWRAGHFGYAAESRNALARALGAALGEGAPAVSPAHLLAALGIGLDLDIQALLRAIEPGARAAVSAAPPSSERPLPFSCDLREVIRLARATARARRHEAIAPAHILFGFLVCEARSPMRFTTIPIDAVRARLGSVRVVLASSKYPLSPAPAPPPLDSTAAEIGRLTALKEEALANQAFEDAARLRDLLALQRSIREKLKDESPPVRPSAGWATRFSQAALAILESARQADGDMVRPGIQPTHLLSAILSAEGSRAWGVLHAAAVDMDALRSGLQSAAGSPSPPTSLNPSRVSPSTVAVLLAASAEAGGLGCDAIGSEHLLVGLLSVRDEAPARLLGVEGLTLDAARFAALELSLVRGT